MALTNVVDKTVKMGLDDIIYYQIMTFCYFNNIPITRGEIRCLVELSKVEFINNAKFCELLSQTGILKSIQTARNFLTNLKRYGMIEKDNKHNIRINPNICVVTSGNILLNHKIIFYEGKK